MPCCNPHPHCSRGLGRLAVVHCLNPTQEQNPTPTGVGFWGARYTVHCALKCTHCCTYSWDAGEPVQNKAATGSASASKAHATTLGLLSPAPRFRISSRVRQPGPRQRSWSAGCGARAGLLLRLLLPCQLPLWWLRGNPVGETSPSGRLRRAGRAEASTSSCSHVRFRCL